MLCLGVAFNGLGSVYCYYRHHRGASSKTGDGVCGGLLFVIRLKGASVHLKYLHAESKALREEFHILNRKVP